MKFSILLFLCLFAVSARGQITLEHTYPFTANSSNNQNNQLGLVEVDSAIWRYISYNGKDSVSIINLDHTLDREILFHPPYPGRIVLVQRHLFDLDSSYEFLVEGGGHDLSVLKESGASLFSCDNCYFGSYRTADDATIEGHKPSGIIATPSGVKMIIRRTDSGGAGLRTEVYSLPGKLPSCPATAGVVNSAGFINEANFPSSAYPNPSSGPIHVTYELPAGVSHGEIILTSEDGREVKRYRVTNAFSDILLQNSELPSGSYFYTVVTERGASAAKRIVVVR